MFKSAGWMAAALAAVCVASGAAAAPSCPNAGFTVAEMTPTPATHEVLGGPRGRLDVRREQFTTTADLAEIKLGVEAIQD